MLILTRKVGEVIRIGNDVRIMVTEIRGDKVRIGIEAPPHVSIYRQEVYAAILRENPPDETGTFGVAKFDDPK
jgi:carbon storage regulator